MKPVKIIFAALLLLTVSGCASRPVLVGTPPPAPEARAQEPAGDIIVCAPEGERTFPDRLKIKLFDTAVNAGHARAYKILQEALSDLDPEAKLVVDGRIGPKTMAALCGLSLSMLMETYALRQALFYQGIVARKPSQEKFLKGWLRRAAMLPDYEPE